MPVIAQNPKFLSHNPSRPLGVPANVAPSAGGIWNDIVEGVQIGNQFQRRKDGENRSVLSDRKPSKGDPGYSKSYAADLLTGTHPENLERLNLAGRVGVPIGRIIGDTTGFGSQSYTWNMHPLDITSTFGRRKLGAMGATPGEAQTGAWLAANVLGYASGNWNPLNLGEGGRQLGYQAISANENDPTKSDNPVADMAVWRGLFGRTGKLLDYEQFSKERPDVSFEKYDKYKEYMRESGFLGLAKATTDGVDGAEARIMGYRVTPGGVAATLGTLGLAGALVKARMIGRG